MALAIWIMGNGSVLPYGIKWAINSFSKADCKRIYHVLNVLYGIKASVNKANVPNQWAVYIWSESMPVLRSIVKEHMIPSMYYKVHL